jgi:nucleotide-binding universal stress UspA family protein
MNTIALGLDASKGSREAVRWTTGVAADTGARVVAVHVMPRSQLWTLGALQVDAKPVVDEIRSLLDGTWIAPLARPGFRTRRGSCAGTRPSSSSALPLA